MNRLALHLNDAGITLLDERSILYREPGFALLGDHDLATGNAAFASARINPRRIQNRYWSELSATPLVDQRFGHLTTADLAIRQLEQLWEAAGTPGAQVVVAVPPYLDPARLGLFLGIAAEIDMPVAALVDAAVAATRREYRNAVPVHIDMGLHATTLTRLSQAGQAQFERSEVLNEFGIYALYDAWLTAIAEAFVQQSRFDPLHTAATEQILLDRLAGWLALASRDPVVAMELEYAGIPHRAEIESLALIAAVAPFYQQISSRLRALYRAGELPAIQVSDRIARLPGLADMLKARIGGEVYALEPGATARGALARCPDQTAAGGSVSLLRQLPWDQSPFVIERPEVHHADGDVPTHVLFGSQAYAIGETPLVLGSQAGDAERSIPLAADMPGMSRRHCSLARIDGRCVVEDHSRYGTFLNGHRINGSTVLQVGDTIRIGSPGFEFQLITTDEKHGSTTA
ncbi:MAG: FHA domain-containing protein [Gammaproteobacteria bacterium]|nr:FHA domain-containing protein [Gammaproteobacteria bacterium]MDH5308759.1 FHA domain-containing protein [Gammaproteobacteria bacterium]